MANVHVPKFGSWDDDDEDIAYTQYFNTAHVKKSGRGMINPNDPCENPSAFPVRGSPICVPSTVRSNSDPEWQNSKRRNAKEYGIHRRQAMGVHMRHEASARKLIDPNNRDGKTGTRLSKRCNTNGLDATTENRSGRTDPRHRIHFNLTNFSAACLDEDSRSIRRHRHQENLGHDPPPLELGRSGNPSSPPTCWEEKVSLDDDLVFSPPKPRTGHPHPTSQRKLGILKEVDPSSSSVATLELGKVREAHGNGRKQAQGDPIPTCITCFWSIKRKTERKTRK